MLVSKPPIDKNSFAHRKWEESLVTRINELIAASSSGGNAFGLVAVSGQSDVVADSAGDTLTLVAGSNITITTNAGTDSVTINSSGAVSSVSNSDGSLTISPTTGAVIASLNVANANTWTASQTFNNSTPLIARTDVDISSSFGTTPILKFGDPGIYQFMVSADFTTTYGGFFFHDGGAGRMSIRAGDIISDVGTFQGDGAGISNINLNAQSGPLLTTKGGTGVALTFTQGSVVFAGALGLYAQDNANFYWDDTNNRLGIGTGSTVSAKIHSLATTEQLRLGYDSSNYVTSTVDSAGNLALQTTAGSTAGIYTLTPHGAGGDGTNRTLSFGRAWGNAALFLYNNGATARFGWGMRADTMQFFAPTTTGGMFCWNRGGDLQPTGTNEIMRLQQYAAGTGAGLGMGRGAFGGTTPYRIDLEGVSATIGTAGVENIIRFSRPISGGVSYPEAFAIGIGRYSSSGFGPDTRVDFLLKSTATSDIVPDAGVMSLNSNGRVLVGGVGAAAAVLHSLGTTEQFRAGYDASNYLSVTINSTGSATLNLVGTSPEFTFSEAVNVPDEAYGISWDNSLEVPTKNAVYDKIQSLSPGGGGNFEQATLDFGAASSLDYNATVTVAAAWVTSSSIILCAPSGEATADHDAEDYILEGITASVTNIVNGVSFDVIAGCASGTYGDFIINCTGN